MTNLLVRTFSALDQTQFAELSGDWNPIHVDALTARRSSFGQIVHGMHSVTWALETFLSAQNLEGISLLKVTFFRPIKVDDLVELSWSTEGNDTLILIQRLDSVLASIRVTPGPKLSCTSTLIENEPLSHRPAIKSFAELAGERGEIAVPGNKACLHERFPALLDILGPCRVATLLALSRLVGMECPGLHSLFAGLEINFESDAASHLRYEVIRHTSQNAPIRLNFRSGGTYGQLDAFFRPASVNQLKLTEISKIVECNEFKDQVALIVGGSRGLGEVTAKIVAAGGGSTVITYSLGKEESSQVEEEIRANGGICKAIKLDVLNNESLRELRVSGMPHPTHLYYFASPPIAANHGRSYDHGLFNLFSAYYVNGLNSLLDALSKNSRLSVFYPSTAYIDEAPAGFAEYVAAKTAGESLCKTLNRDHPNLQFLVERLPRLHTDQTNSIFSKKAAEPAEIMLNAVRKMNFAGH